MSDHCRDCGVELTAENVWEPGTCRSCASKLTPADLHGSTVPSYVSEDYEPKKGDGLACYDHKDEVYAMVDVVRVSPGKWADILVFSNGSTWRKRQPLPWRIRAVLLSREGEIVL